MVDGKAKSFFVDVRIIEEFDGLEIPKLGSLPEDVELPETLIR